MFFLTSASRIVFVVTSNNKLVSCTATDRQSESALKKLLQSINPKLKNMVFPNGVIIFAFEQDGLLHFHMHTDIEITNPNHTDPETFNLLQLTAPIPSGFRKGTVFVLIRHGQAWHNKPPAECDKFLRGNPEMVAQMLELAQKRDSDIDLSTLDYEQKIKLALKTLRQDAALTPQGQEEGLAIATKLNALIDSSCLLPPPMTFFSSKLERTQNTAAIIASHLGHTGPIYACAALNEINREMFSEYWSLGTKQRAVAESMNASMYEYVTSILKDPPQMSEEWNEAAPEFREPFENRVNAILAENTPCFDGPTSFCGLPIVHRACTLPFDGDLINALPRISNIVAICSGNKGKMNDIRGVLGDNLTLESFDKPEIQELPLLVAEQKARTMHKELGGQSVFVEDVSVGDHEWPSVSDANIKGYIKEAEARKLSLPQYLEKRYGGVKEFNYQSTCVSMCVGVDGNPLVITTWCQAICELKHLSKEEKEKLVGDIDPYAKVKSRKTWSQVNSEKPVLVGFEEFDACDGLSVAEKQKLDPSYRRMLHPREAAVKAQKDLWIAHGIMW
jgi:broad specificity phosphatase PhoE